jgi:GT2 family glycosyltransferase
MSLFWRKAVPLLRHRPLSALRAIYWHLTRRRIRAGNIVRDASRGLPLAYHHWLIGQEEEVARVAGAIGPDAADLPTITVIIHYSDDCPSALRRLSRQSVEKQRLRPNAVVETPLGKLGDALSQDIGDYLLLLRAGDRLAESGLFRLALFLQAQASPVAYGDEDWPDANGGAPTPWFKGNWNREMFLGLDYLSSAVTIRTDLARAVASKVRESGSPVDTLVLEAINRAGDDVAHLAAILVHKGGGSRSPSANRVEAVSAAVGADVRCKPGPFATTHVQWPLPQQLPLVSIIIPTRDRLELLRTCIESVDAHTDYRPFEWIVVDNGSAEVATLDYLAELSMRPDAGVIRSEGPFNFSRLNNLGIAAARGEFVLLLNNDTEAFSREWLAEMMRQAVRDEVGAVGAQLLYDDGSLQHAGVVIGMGEAAGHAHRFLPADDPGYFRLPHVAQEVSAVTAACLLVRKERYLAVGGLDEENFAVAYNDVDFCLRLKEAGWRNIYTPHAKLYHHESKSRGSDFSAVNRERYLRELKNLQIRWGTRTFVDPLHSPHLDRYSETFRPGF